ncbi:MAG: hypothetical protein WBP93_18495 [Pyrinomonadaceae bacterium]
MSINPMQRISDLEAQVATLTAENKSLQLNGNGNGHLDLEKLIEKLVGKEFDRFGRLFREEYTGKIAGMITPYIENTVRRCADTEKKQTTLEDRFKAHEEAIGKNADSVTSTFKKLRAEAEKDWKTYRAQMQEDFGRVDEFVKWAEAETANNWQENTRATTNCTLAVSVCTDLLKKLDKPVEESIKHLKQVKQHGDSVINSAAEDLTKTYRSLRQPVLSRVTLLLIFSIFIHLGVGTVVLWRNRSLIDTNWQELSAHSDQQKQEIKGLLDKTIEEAKESQIDRELKVKMWDALMKSLSPQQKEAVISKFREQVNEAERKRINDQMKSSYEQMNEERK